MSSSNGGNDTTSTTLTEEIKEFIDNFGYFYVDSANLSRHLVCFCEEPFHDPIILTACSHVFCRACILSWISASPEAGCPTCRTPITHASPNSFLTPAPKLIQDLLDELTCICPLGCGVERARGEMRGHLERECKEVRKQIANAHRGGDNDSDAGSDASGHSSSSKLLNQGDNALELRVLRDQLRKTREIVRRQGTELTRLRSLAVQVQQMGGPSQEDVSNGVPPSVHGRNKAKDSGGGSGGGETPRGGGGGSSSSRNGGQKEHDAVCDSCGNGQRHITGVRYKCMICPDYDLCERCYRERRRHAHAFFPIKNPDDVRITSPPHWSILHANVQCDNCKGTVSGERYKCMHRDCRDYDLCQKCVALPTSVHPTDHCMLRIVVPSSHLHGHKIRSA